jgi:LacI family transcriptional regulator
MSMGQVTTSDVARHAAVSRGTVSRVLNNHANVTEAMRQRVLKVAHDLGYFAAKGQASHVFARRNNALYTHQGIGDIGFFFSSILPKTSATNNPFWSPILHGAEREARQLSTNVIYRSVSPVAQSAPVLAADISTMKLGGILLVGSAEIDLVRALQQTGVPLVLVDLFFPDIAIDSVIVDNMEGIRLVMQRLLSLGHRHIAYIGGPVSFKHAPYPRTTGKIYSLEQRLAGYFHALLEIGVPLDYDLVQTGDLNVDGGYQGAQALLANDHPFSAIVCANDETAIGAMKAIQEHGRRVPEDISVAGFDDIESARHVTPDLTTVRVDKESMGAIAVRTLASRILDPAATTVTAMLKVHFVERGSIAVPSRRPYSVSAPAGAAISSRGGKKT